MAERSKFNKWLDKVEYYLARDKSQEEQFRAIEMVEDWTDILKKYFEQGKTPVEAAMIMRP